jgi:hypothetical protein
MSLTAEPSIGCDHTLLIFSTGEDAGPRSTRFFFEKGWLALPGFTDLFRNKWFEFGRTHGHCFDLLDLWQFHSRKLRSFLRGWGANLRREAIVEKDDILQQIQVLILWRMGLVLMMRVGVSVILGRISNEYLSKRGRLLAAT